MYFATSNEITGLGSDHYWLLTSQREKIILHVSPDGNMQYRL